MFCSLRLVARSTEADATKMTPRRIATDGGFVRQASVLALGTILGQVAVLAGAPILTRLYQPEAIGAWAFLSAIAMALANVGNGKYELAIVLPRSDGRAVNLVALCLFTQFCVLTLVCIGIVFVQSSAGEALLDFPISSDIVWLVPVMVSASALYAVCRYWTVRKQQFGTLAGFIMLESWLLTALQIVAGLAMSGGAMEFVLAGVAAMVTLAMAFTTVVMLQMCPSLGCLRAARILALAKRYRNFPVYSAPYAFLGMASSRILLVLFGFYAAPAAVGYFALAMRVTSLPNALVSSALNNAFFSWASRHVNDREAFAGLIRRVLHPMIILGAPGVVLFVLNAEWLFAMVFGADWAEAGRYARYLVVGSFALLLSAWLDNVYSVLQKQKLSLVLESIYDLAMVTSVFVCLAVYRDPLLAVIVFSVTTALYNIVWLVVMFVVVKLPAALFFEIIGLLLLMVVIALAVHGLAGLLLGFVGYALACCGFLMLLGIYSGRSLYTFAKGTA